MKDFILKRILGFVGQKLDGYKTKIGGAGGIILGVLGLVKMIFPDQLPALPDMGIEASLGAISAGFAVLGLGGKIEKNTQAVKATVPGELIGGAFVGDIKESPKDAGKP